MTRESRCAQFRESRCSQFREGLEGVQRPAQVFTLESPVLRYFGTSVPTSESEMLRERPSRIAGGSARGMGVPSRISGTSVLRYFGTDSSERKCSATAV